MLPKKFVIGNVPYEIKKVESTEEDDGTQFWGLVNYDEQNITIANHLKRESMIKTLIHEAIHAMLHEGGMTKYNKEDFVDRLSAALYDFLVNNDLSFLQQGNDSDNLRNTAENLGIVTQISTSDVIENMLNEVKTERPRKLPINNDRSLSVPIKDLKTEEPDHWKTGIKLKDGIECFKTRYECVECGNKGTRYVPDDIDYVKCHECNYKMQKIPATREGFPQRDNWGNFYIAGEVQPYEKD